MKKKACFDSIDQIWLDSKFFTEIESPLITARIKDKHYEIVPLGSFASLWRRGVHDEIE